MPKLRKMLGDVNSPECTAMMKLIETQSKSTLAGWAIGYAKENYLGIYKTERPGASRLEEIISACEEYLSGSIKLAGIKPFLKEGQEIARSEENPVCQAAARAISTACSTINTPTNALGFLFYGAAAVAYSTIGLDGAPGEYDGIAAEEFRKARASLETISVKNEENPANIKWNC